MRAKLNLSALSAIAILACCVFASAQKPAPSSAPTPGIAPAPVSAEEPATGTISGSIVNEGGQPMPGVSVYVREVNPAAPGRSSSTNAEGNFRVNGLGPGLYTVTAFSPAYTTQRVDPESPPPQYRLGDTVKIQLVRGGVITGTVTNAGGEPVIGVRVRASMTRNVKGERPTRTASFAYIERTTDDRGIYRLFGLPPGSYLVSAGGSMSTQAFVLNPFDSDVPTYAPSSTRDNATEVVVRPGEESSADIRYRGDPGHTVSGSIKLSGSTNASVSLTMVGSVIPTANAFQMGERGFAFHGVGDGEYDIVAQEAKSGLGPIVDLLMSERRRITVKGADITGLELVTRPLASINGRITLEPTKVAECAGKRRPLFAETAVIVQRPEKEEKEIPPHMRMLAGTGLPDANGNFVMRNLLPGRYLFEPRFYARYWYLNSISVASTPKVDAAANWTTLKSGDQLANLTITIAEGASSVRGRVTAANAAEVPAGLAVYFIPAEREKALDVLRYFVATVEPDATFALNNLPPGRYLPLVQPIDSQASTIAKLRLPEAVETRTKLRRAAESQKVDLELKPCQNLTDYKLALK